MKCPKCNKEHNEWHGNFTCFECATNELLEATNKLKKELEEDE